MQKEIAIIGGGISGLCFAHFCAVAGFKATLFEKNNLGGCLQSFSLTNDHYVELGGHTLTNSYQTVIEILEYYQKADSIQEKERLRFERYDGSKFTSLLKPINFWSLVISLPKLFFVNKTGKTIKEYYGTVLGAKNYERLFRFLFRAILCQDPDAYPAEKLFKKRSKLKSYPKKFVLKKGMKQLFEIIGANPNITIQENIEITGISKNETYFDIWNGNNHLKTVPYLGFAANPFAGTTLFKTAYPNIAKALENIQSKCVETALITIDDPAAIANRNKSILGQEGFLSAMYVPHNSTKYWCFYFKGNLYSDEEKKKQIAVVFDVSEASVKFITTQKFKLPKVTFETLENTKFIDKSIQNSGMFFTTNYMDGLAIEDCCLRSKLEASRLIKEFESLKI